MPENNAEKQLKVHVKHDLEYSYRDMFNIFISPEDVTIEFGNRHRSVENEATINNRIVLSLSNAAKLQRSLQEALVSLQKHVKERMEAGGNAEN
ncbi:MAG: DUF3467 domain-containing protein [Desulfovibrio sp.]|nr:MAG: DUF3467 domain-containing protein [Desulfovibrio sp.]